MKTLNIAFYLIAGVLISSLSYADVPILYREVAQAERVPAKLFFAMILQESKSKIREKKKALPWPWTINHRGRPLYFPDQEGATKYAQSLIDAGDLRFDIGLSQMNWYWHGQRFQNAREALEPKKNLSEAARYLRIQFDRDECNHWITAVGCYHRSAQSEEDKLIAYKYAKSVLEIWKTL